MNSRELKPNPTSPDRLDNLTEELVGFAIVSLQGQILGQVERVSFDRNHRPKLVISRSGAWGGSPLVWLSGELIQTVERATRSLYVNLSPVELEHLPPYESEDRTVVDEQRIIEKQNIPLLEEKLVVKRSKRKVGEVIVRKEIETRMVQVPVRREKLIVEQIGEETQKLAEVDLGQEEVIGVEYQTATQTDGTATLQKNFLSPRTAGEALEAIALHQPHGCQKVRVEIVLENSELEQKYRALLDRFEGESEVSSEPMLPDLP